MKREVLKWFSFKEKQKSLDCCFLWIGRERALNTVNYIIELAIKLHKAFSLLIKSEEENHK